MKYWVKGRHHPNPTMHTPYYVLTPFLFSTSSMWAEKWVLTKQNEEWKTLKWMPTPPLLPCKHVGESTKVKNRTTPQWIFKQVSHLISHLLFVMWQSCNLIEYRCVCFWAMGSVIVQVQVSMTFKLHGTYSIQQIGCAKLHRESPIYHYSDQGPKMGRYWRLNFSVNTDESVCLEAMLPGTLTKGAGWLQDYTHSQCHHTCTRI